MKRVIILVAIIFGIACLPISSLLASEKEVKQIKLGLFPFISPSRLIKIFAPLKLHLEKQLGAEVQLLTAPNFRDFVVRTSEEQYDIVFTAPHFASLAINQGSYHAMFRFSRDLTGTIFIEESSQIKAVDDLQNKVISVPDELAIISIMTEVYFDEQKIPIKKFVPTPSHNNAILAVLNHKADAGVVATPVFDMYVARNKNKIKPLAQTGSVPGSIFMVRDKKTEEEKNNIIKAFQEFPASEYGERFIQNTPFDGLKAINDEDLMLLKPYLTILERKL